MRARLILTTLLACTLLACSLVTQSDEQVEVNQVTQSGEQSEATPDTQSSEQVEATSAPPPSVSSPPPSTASTSAVPYFGEESIEERIARADIIVRARLSTTTSKVVRGTGEGWSDYYYVALKFHLTVSEYLYGVGANDITAFTIQSGNYGTQREAEDAKLDIISNRVSTWDVREAIIFLTEDDSAGAFSAEVQGANDYFLIIGGPVQDMYSLHNKHRKLWLPVVETTATGDSQEFLLAVPEPGKDTPTITIRELKSRIAAVDAELNAGDGSDAYKDCIRDSYRIERTESFRMSNWSGTNPRHSFEPAWDGTFASGQPAGTEVYDYSPGFAKPADMKERLWIDGRDASLFAVKLSELRPVPDRHKVGQYDGFDFDLSVVSARPIPAGTYEFNHHSIPWRFLPCVNTFTFEITANVQSPDGVLHEMFFDPVSDGSSVAADSANGVLKPASFTGADGASATISRIAWESGVVKIEVSPHAALGGHTLDFIELDGSVSLSLNVNDAQKDTSAGTLTWSVPDQPWHDGDLLMVRIRRSSPTPPPTGLRCCFPLGLPDFYNSTGDPRLHGEKAIMKYQWEAGSIQDTDIEQLRGSTSHTTSTRRQELRG